MKHSLLSMSLVMLTFCSLQSQIELEFTYPSPNVTRSLFPLTGERYVWRDAQPGVIELYDKDHELQEVIDANIEGADLLFVNFLSEGIFSPEPGLFTIAAYDQNNQTQTRILDPDMETVFIGDGAGTVIPLRAEGDEYYLTFFTQNGPEFDIEVYSIPEYNLLKVVEDAVSPLRRVTLDDGNYLFYTLNNLNQVLLFDDELSQVGSFPVGVGQDEIPFFGLAAQTFFDDDFKVEFIVSVFNIFTGEFSSMVIEQSGVMEFSTDNFIAPFGDLEEGFSFYTPTSSGIPNVYSDYKVYTAKNYVFEQEYSADGVISFQGQMLEESGKSIILLREDPLLIEQYNADHEFVLSVEPEINVTADQNPSLISVSEGLLGTDGLECLLGLFGPMAIEATYLVNEEGAPYFSTGFGEFVSPSFFPGVLETKIIGTVLNDPNGQVTNVYSIDVLDAVEELPIPAIHLQLFPNPTAESIQLFVPYGNPGDGRQVPFQIHNQLGQTVQAGNLDTYQGVEISLDDIPAGTYFIRVEVGDNIVTRTFVKE